MDNFYFNHTRPMNFNGFYEPSLHGLSDNDRLFRNSYISNLDREYNNFFGSYWDHLPLSNWARSWGERHLPVQNWSSFQNWLPFQSWSPVQSWNTVGNWDERYTPSYNLSSIRGWNDRHLPLNSWMNARGFDNVAPIHGYLRGIEDRMPMYNTSSIRNLDDQFYPSYNSNVLRGFDDRYVPIHSSSINDIRDRQFGGYTSQSNQTCMLGNIPHNHALCTEQRIYEPATYLIEEHDATVIQIELFGVSDKDFRVMTIGNNLIIEGFKEVSMMNSQKTKNTHQAQLYFMGPVWHGAFKRVISLGYLLEATAINASFSNGVLTLTVKKPQSHKSEFVKIVSK